jgi:hypothetical protein
MIPLEWWCDECPGWRTMRLSVTGPDAVREARCITCGHTIAQYRPTPPPVSR